MRLSRWILLLCLCIVSSALMAQETDSIVSDSARIARLQQELEAAKLNEAALRIEVEQLNSGTMADSIRKARLRHRIDSLKTTNVGALVIVEDDTLFTIYAKQGGLAPKERADMISKQIEHLGKLFTLQPDSVYILRGDFETDIMYDKDIIISLTEMDGLWENTSRDELAESTRGIIVDELHVLKREYGLWKLIKRIVSLLVIIIAFYAISKIINIAYRKLVKYIVVLKQTRLKPFFIQRVELLDIKKQVKLLMFLARLLRLVCYAVVLILTVPLLFSLFPQTSDLAYRIVSYILTPISRIFSEVVAYVPNLFTIFVICFVIHYVVKLLKYLAKEIAADHLKISGFFPEWGMPTFYILRFLLYAFMVAMIYPYLPGSNSGVFQGISVFIGLIVSLGSSSVIGNLIAGLVITYMRPFKMGDRIKIQDVTGDVIEKTPFVTRIRTPKNEVVTMPNSFIMSSQSINYSQSARQYGLIIHTDVTMGYEISWRKINRLLIDAALNTPGVVDDPRPFVLQTDLGDHYTVYQLNAYIQDAKLLPDIYSYLHENIQDLFAREGLELVSPHYYSQRDGNKSTICNMSEQ